MKLIFCRSESLFQTNYTIRHSLTALRVSEGSWHLHSEAICNGARKLLGFLWRAVASGLSELSILILYRSILGPILDYASKVWKPYYIHRITKDSEKVCKDGWFQNGLEVS
ncbi:hypothetical protein J6590_047866 [Homalodisca vitripennis]|nr:hypothetical protein J6590_047866 [Homalodisca vitripennis]